MTVPTTDSNDAARHQSPHAPPADRPGFVERLDPTGDPAWRPAARRAFVATLPVYVASRLAVYVVARIVTWLYPQLTVTSALSGWDGGWYLTIAADGYPGSIAAEGGGGVRWAFFPGLPLAIRGLSEMTGLSLASSGIVLSIACGAFAVAAIWMLVERVLDARVATVTASLMCFFPAAYVLSMVYTEGLFLMVSAVGLYATTTRRWLTAGAMASIACLLRAPGLVLVLVLLVAAGRETAARRLSLRLLAGLVLSGAGFAAWSIYQLVRLGDPSAYTEAQRIGWYNEFAWFSTPFRSLWRVLTDADARAEGTEVMGALGLIVVVIAGTLAVAFVRRHRGVVPMEWWVYSAGSLAFAFAPFWPSSILRYTFALFPLFAVAMAQLPRRLVTPLLCLSASAMAGFCAVAIAGIVNWQNAPFAP